MQRLEEYFQRRSIWTASWAALFIVTIFCFGPSLSGPFVYDDTALVRDNPDIHEFSNATAWFEKTLDSDHGPSRYYRPVLLASFAADWAVWGARPAAFHAVNLLWHLANIALMACLAARIGWKRPAVFLSAALFALQPLHAQAVCYISGRGDVQFLGLALLACHCALCAWERPRRGRIWNTAAGLLLIAAVLTKEMGLLILAWVPLLAWLRREPRSAWLPTSIGLLAAALLALGLRIAMVSSSISAAGRSAREIVLLIGASAGFYAQHFVAPVTLALERDLDLSVPSTVFHLILGTAVLIAFGLAVVRFWKQSRRRALFCMGWALAAYLPVSNIFRLSATAADHWIYPISPALCWAAALAFFWVWNRPGSDPKKIAAFLLIGLLGAWSLRLYLRSGEWSSGLALYEANLEQGIGTSRIHNNYGVELASSGRLREALEAFRQSLALDPGNLSAKSNEAYILFRSGKREEGLARARALADAHPECEQAWVVLMLMSKDRPGEVRRIGEEALRTGGSFPKVRALIRRSDGPSP